MSASVYTDVKLTHFPLCGYLVFSLAAIPGSVAHTVTVNISIPCDPFLPCTINHFDHATKVSVRCVDSEPSGAFSEKISKPESASEAKFAVPNLQRQQHLRKPSKPEPSFPAGDTVETTWTLTLLLAIFGSVTFLVLLMWLKSVICALKAAIGKQRESSSDPTPESKAEAVQTVDSCEREDAEATLSRFVQVPKSGLEELPSRATEEIETAESPRPDRFTYRVSNDNWRDRPRPRRSPSIRPPLRHRSDSPWPRRPRMIRRNLENQMTTTRIYR